MSTQRWVIFQLEADQYALPLERVVEVVRVVAMRAVPNGPAWLVGVINRRGRGLPIMDLRVRLGRPPLPPRLDTRIIVTDVGGPAGECLMGLLADEVLDVLTQPSETIDLPPTLTSGGLLVSSSGRGLEAVQTGERLVMVFDVERLGLEAQALPGLARSEA